MKRSWSIKLSLLLLGIIFVGIVVHAPFIVAVGSIFPGLALPIKAWKEILMIVVGILLMAEIIRRKKWQILWDSWAIRLMWAFIALHILLLPLFWQGLPASVAGLMIDLRFVVFFALVYIFIVLEPKLRPLFWKFGAIGAMIVIGFGFLQLFLPHDILKYLGYSLETIRPYTTVDQNYDFIRINSTLRGPNPLGAFAMIVIAFLVAFSTSKRWNFIKSHWWKILLVSLATATVLYLSHSRSAWLGAIVAVAIVLFVRYREKISQKVMILGVVGLLLTGGVIYLVRDNSFVSTVILHEDPAEGGDTNSNDGHLKSLIDGSRRMINQPLGAGIGSTGSASVIGDKANIIENQFLFTAHEVGWLGLGVFMAIYVLILMQLWQLRDDWRVLAVFASGVGMLVIGMLLPVFVDDTVSIIWWGLAAVALGGINEAKLAKETRLK